MVREAAGNLLAPMITHAMIDLIPAMLLLHRLLSLLLAADENDVLSPLNHLPDKVTCFPEQYNCLLKVNNVYTIALTENVLFHLGVPACHLMPEVYSCFE